MAFDPLSLIGYVGVAMGAINFFLSTIPRIKQFRHDFRTASQQLSDYNIDIILAMITFRAWEETWSRGARKMQKDDYIYFWGVDGYRHVRDRLTEIINQVDEIGRGLYANVDVEQPERRFDMTEHDWRQWHAGLKERVDNFEPNAGWTKKLGMALGDLMILDGRSSRLKRLTEQLLSLSKAKLQERGFRTIKGEITDAALARILDHKNWVTEYSNVLTKLHSQSLSEWGTWSLVLRAPDPEGNVSSNNQENSFLVEFDSCPEQSGGDTDTGIVKFRPHSACRFPDLVEWYAAEVAGNHVLRDMPQSRNTTTLFNWFHHQVQSLSNLDFVETALALANWTVLLWQTPWTNGICTCQIRFVKVAHQDTSDDGTTDVATFTAAIYCAKDPDRTHIPGRKALSLAISLTELAIKQPLILNQEIRGRTTFSVGGLGNKTFTQEELLGRISATKGAAFRRAVEYCFWYDNRERQERRRFQPDDIIHFEERVLQQIEPYYLAQRENDQRRKVLGLPQI
ncbi:hypothetical protein B0T17DRAFT_149874 [Bombardia bombarda]|uniref:Uncharacterized protein n=1 Tax=Bombardia bombarda TaxID=252184 RepID=A0AA39X7E8_9PEZI|nr:hypothetical protein B0T17DRAFT_149874 [Bombardia bombarda]